MNIQTKSDIGFYECAYFVASPNSRVVFIWANFLNLAIFFLRNFWKNLFFNAILIEIISFEQKSPII